MAYYRYVKAPVTFVAPAAPAPGISSPEVAPKHSFTLSEVEGPVSGNKARNLVPPVLITLGSLLIANVIWPMISYQLFTAPSIRRTEYISPVPREQLGDGLNLKTTAQTPAVAGLTTVRGADVDYTNVKNWFPAAQFGADGQSQKIYNVDIPALDIEDAEVVIGGEDLDKNLIQYPGTAMPGQLGSPVIFGHSVLRQFYNPDIGNPSRYLSIFSKIMTLKTGDRIFIDYDGIRYAYEVKEKVEVQPEDVFILEQRYNNRELKLITCVPEGTYLRRGVIIAQLVDLN